MCNIVKSTLCMCLLVIHSSESVNQKKIRAWLQKSKESFFWIDTDSREVAVPTEYHIYLFCQNVKVMTTGGVVVGFHFTSKSIRDRSSGTGRKKLKSLFVMFLYQFHSKKKAHNPNTQITRFFLGVILV